MLSTIYYPVDYMYFVFDEFRKLMKKNEKVDNLLLRDIVCLAQT